MEHDQDKTAELNEESQEVEEQASENEAVSQEETLEDKVATLKDQLLRALAEVENTRKRGSREIDEAKKYAISSFARDILAVADNLRRGLESISEEQAKSLPDEFKTMLEGMKLTEKELLSVFEKHGVKKITPVGESFDHSLHQAMFEIETTDHPAGSVVEVMQPGYVLDSRLLRPAMVGIAKAPKEADKS